MRIFRLLLITNVVVFGLTFLLQALIYSQNGGLSNSLNFQIFDISGGLYSVDIVLLGKIWTLVTANFAHMDPLHFLFNMYALFKIGQIVLEFYDGKKLFITYIIGGIVAMLLSVVISVLTLFPTLTLGASGSIFALAGLLIGGAVKDRRYGVNLPINLQVFVPIIFVSLLFGFIPGSGINNVAHLGGVLAGFVLGLILKHDIGEYESKTEKTIVNFFYYTSLGVFILSFLLHIMYVVRLFINS